MKGLILLGQHSNIPYFRNQTVQLSGNGAGMQLGFKKNSAQAFPDGELHYGILGFHLYFLFMLNVHNSLQQSLYPNFRLDG